MKHTGDKEIVKTIRATVVILCLGVLLGGIIYLPQPAGADTRNLEDILERYIREHYPWPEVTITDLSVSGEIPKRHPAKIIIEKGLPGKTVFTLEFGDSGRLKAIANVKAFDRVVVSRRAFRKGRILQDDDVYVMLMDVRKIPAGAVRSIDQVSGKPLTRSVIANMPVVSGMLSETPVVKRGTRVTLLLEADSFTITTTGETKENSSVGKQVKAVNTASKRSVTGVLIDENTVRVEL